MICKTNFVQLLSGAASLVDILTRILTLPLWEKFEKSLSLHILTIFGQYFSIIYGNLSSILKFYESDALKLLWLCMEKFEISVRKSTSDIRILSSCLLVHKLQLNSQL